MRIVWKDTKPNQKPRKIKESAKKKPRGPKRIA